MKLIIAGSRTIEVNEHTIQDLISHFDIKPDIVLSGGASGIDSCGERYADLVGAEIELHKAEWDKYGRAAGPRRNEQMAKEADALLLIWDGGSNGSRNMKQNMKHLGKPVYEVILMGDNNE